MLKDDPVCKQLILYSSDGWPPRIKLPPFITPYYQYRHDRSFSENLVLKDTRIIVPPDIHNEVIGYIHSGHQGITKCRKLVQNSVWWLGLSSQIEELVRNCSNCIKERCNYKKTFKCGIFLLDLWKKLV